MVEPSLNKLEVAPREAVMEAARRFAGALAETEPFIEFEQALYAFRHDAGAQQAIRDFREKQASLKAMLALNALSPQDRQALQELADRVNNRPSVQRYNQAQMALAALCQQIGDQLSQAAGVDFAAACRTGGCCG